MPLLSENELWLQERQNANTLAKTQKQNERKDKKIDIFSHLTCCPMFFLCRLPLAKTILSSNIFNPSPRKSTLMGGQTKRNDLCRLASLFCQGLRQVYEDVCVTIPLRAFTSSSFSAQPKITSSFRKPLNVLALPVALFSPMS